MSTDPAPATHGQKADRGSRILAFALDAMLLIVPCAVMLVLAPFRALGNIQEEASIFAGFHGLAVLLFQVALASRGQSFGQAVIGLEFQGRSRWPGAARKF